MSLFNPIYRFFNKKIFGHLLFWIVMLFYYMSISWPYETDKVFLFESVLFKMVLQIIVAYSIIYIIIPHTLNKKFKLLFFISSIILIYIAYIAYSAFRCFYLLPTYPELFAYRPPLDFVERITNFYTFTGGIPSYIFPTIILSIFDYYKHQKEIANLLEQKKTSELNALKNQLNPHFLFNTLNNLYALALKKSDETPEVIAKLSEILDYMLYRCKDNFVSLNNEIKLLDNYIALEKIRYGKRVIINFDHNLQNEVKIAPLLLLTFVENAFKHGVSQEINTATINITLETTPQGVYFKIQNTKPNYTEIHKDKSRDAIGLQNIIKQLKILYLNHYSLDIDDQKDKYTLILKIAPNGL